MKSLRLWAVSVVALTWYLSHLALFPTHNAWAQHGDSERTESDPVDAAEEATHDGAETPKAKKTPKKAFAGYTKYRGQFVALCEGLRGDARESLIFNLGAANTMRDLECIACRPLFSSLQSACRPVYVKPTRGTPKPEPEATEGEGAEVPEPTPTPRPRIPQRLPSAAVLDALARLLVPIVEDEGGREESFKAIFKFRDLLQVQSSTLDGAGSEYYSTLLVFLMAPLEPYIQANEAKATAVAESAKTPEISPDSLFE